MLESGKGIVNVADDAVKAGGIGFDWCCRRPKWDSGHEISSVFQHIYFQAGASDDPSGNTDMQLHVFCNICISIVGNPDMTSHVFCNI